MMTSHKTERVKLTDSFSPVRHEWSPEIKQWVKQD